MKYNRLGDTGLFVSEICLGAMTFGSDVDAGIWTKLGVGGQAEVDAILRRSLDAGVNFIDSADTYAAGGSETRLGRGLKNLGIARKDVVIATKVFGVVGNGPNDRGASRGHIMDAVRASLDRLQTDHIDLYQIHHEDRITPLDETMRALDDLVRLGMVRYVGVSNWPAWKIAKANGLAEARGHTRINSLQAYYSIAGRDLEREMAPMMLAEKVALMVWSPLAAGLLSGKFGPGADNPEDARRSMVDYPPVDRDRAWACIAAMREIGAAHDASVARVALAWLLAQPVVTSVIIGAKTVAQLDDNLAAADLRLTPEEMARLNEISALPPEYPGWVWAQQDVARMPQHFLTGEKAG